MTLLLSILAYCAIFLFIINKPLTVATATQYFSLKIDYLKATGGSKRILIFAGSNGRFSHRCSYIEDQFHVPCVNLSMAAGSSLVWQFNHYSEWISQGDVLYLPLEYREAGSSEGQGGVGDEAPYIVAYEHSALRDFYRPEQALQALFSFDLRYTISAVAEMFMKKAGVQRRFSPATMDRQGDEKDHTIDKGRAYRDYVAKMVPIRPDEQAYTPAGNWQEEKDLIQLAERRGAIVVGGLPTTTADAVVPASALRFLETFFRAQGGCFIALPNLSQYPRGDFYDSQYHLSEPYQYEHTAALAPHLVNILKSGQCQK